LCPVVVELWVVEADPPSSSVGLVGLPLEPNFQATTTRIVTATIPARATTTKFDSIRRLRGRGRAVADWTGNSSSRAKREVYSSR
jgi:hypothetical protein